jgi:hypothetical protein
MLRGFQRFRISRNDPVSDDSQMRAALGLCFAGLLGSMVTAIGRDSSVAETLIREIGRVERDIQRATSPQERTGVEERLRRARTAAEKGRAFLALHELSTAWRTEAAYTFSGGLVDRVKTFDDFKREWTTVGEPRAPQPMPDAPLVVAALATASESVGPATHRASLPYAEDAGLRAGLYYLGDARAANRFGAFCRGLTFLSAGVRPPLRSIAPEMDRFERDVIKLYDKADANARRSFIIVNVTMKIARERDGSGDYAASLLQYMLARFHLGTVATAGASGDAAARLQTFAKALTGQDHTIAQLFFEMAASSLESPDAKVQRQATAIADFVIPEYVEVIKR